MPLSNSQYDEIMREYDQRQLQDRRILDERRKEVFQKIPKLKELESTVASRSVRQARLLLDGDTSALASLKEELADLSRQRDTLLTAGGYTLDYLDPVYECPDCKDTGYIDSQKCHCFKQAIINTVYAQSNIREILKRENFDHFSYSYYSDEDISPTTGLSALATARHAVEECHRFIDAFDNKPQNLFFYGGTGVGKTFLTNCVAKELLDKGYNLIYITAFQLFDILSKGIIEKDADAIAAHQNIFDCDLLVIDDLGTELSNAFTTSQLFLCVNERLLRHKSTIISTNLSFQQIADIYSERTFSRICGDYTMIKLFNQMDIRILKQQKP